MLCLKCLEFMEQGATAKLKEARESCSVYKANQCNHLGREGSFHQRIQDAAVTVAPSRIAKVLNSAGITTLCVAFVLTAVMFLVNREGYRLEVYAGEQIVYTSLLQELVSQTNDIAASGEIPEAFSFLAGRYQVLGTTLPSYELDIIRNMLLTFGRDAPTFRPSEVYSIVGAIGHMDCVLARIRGFVTNVQEDVLTGVRITISNTLDFEPYSIVVVQPNHLPINVQIGDEVLFLAVPRFINIATPITVYEWIQP